MINRLRTIVSQAMYAPSASQATAVQSSNGYNPFENPFVQPQSQRNTYAINKPVKGGYFAGYHNGKPNIVGRRLFVEA